MGTFSLVLAPLGTPEIMRYCYKIRHLTWDQVCCCTDSELDSCMETSPKISQGSLKPRGSQGCLWWLPAMVIQELSACEAP